MAAEMKCIYICDFMGEPERERHELEQKTGLQITWKEDPNFERQYFDVLFFDWGGASLGNSLLESFCNRILSHAVEHPSKEYVITSKFTGFAMNDALLEFGEAKPANLHLSVTTFMNEVIK